MRHKGNFTLYFNWAKDDKVEVVDNPTDTDRTIWLTFPGSDCRIWLTPEQAETLSYDLAHVLGNADQAEPRIVVGNNAIEKLIQSRDALLSACANLGIVKEEGVSNES